jgi:long-chain acyl-CoA synthetase
MGAREQLLEEAFADAGRTLCLDARGGPTWTYGEASRQVSCLAAALKARGVAPGATVAVSLGNGVDTALLTLACLRLGARIVPIHPAHRPADVLELLRVIRPAALLAAPAVVAGLRAAGPVEVQALCVGSTVDPPRPEHAALVTFSVADEAGRHAPLELVRDGASATFLTIFTSGTTGKPKGVDFTYERLVGNGRAFCARLGLGARHRFYDVLPMTYLGGLYNLFLIPILAGGSVVIDGVFGPTTLYGFWERVRQHGVNALWFNPTMLAQLLALEDDEDLSFVPKQIEVALCGMAALPVDLKARFEARFGLRLHENYGLSETTFVTTSDPTLPFKEGSVGRALDGVEVTIVDAQRRSLPPRVEGQIRVRGPFTTPGYSLGGEADRAAFLPDGSFLTGDLGHLDEDGELFISGRVKDVIIRGGVNIYPRALESVLYGLEGVEEAAVVGVPHSVYGEEVALVIKPRAGATLTVPQVRSFCDASIAAFQRPRHIHFIDAFPRGLTGKLQKSVVRRLLLRRLDALG